jgi:hypothetical protein
MELCIHNGIKVQVDGSDGNTYLRCVDAQEVRAGAEGMDGMTGSG